MVNSVYYFSIGNNWGNYRIFVWLTGQHRNFSSAYILCCVRSFLFEKYFDAKSGKTEAKKRRKQKIKQRKKEMAKRVIQVIHIGGLSLSPQTFCSIEMNENAFIIRGAGNEFYLNKDKVTDISVKSDLEMQMQYVSYTGGAAAGRMTLGSLGAMNGRHEQNKIRKSYLVFTYRNHNDINYLVFSIIGMPVFRALKWIKQFYAQRPENDANSTIEL